MKVEPGPEAGDRKVEMNATEARQARTGHNVRYVLMFGLGGVILAFAIVLLFYTSW
jgi:hypothetical protein